MLELKEKIENLMQRNNYPVAVALSKAKPYEASVPLADNRTFEYPALFVSSGCGSKPITVISALPGL